MNYGQSSISNSDGSKPDIASLSNSDTSNNLHQTSLRHSTDTDALIDRPLELSTIAPIPTSVTETKLSVQLLKDLLLKHIQDAGVASLATLSIRLSLAGSVVEEIVHLLRAEALVELSTLLNGDGTLSFRLTDRGRMSANDATNRSGYIGPAPVSLDHYTSVSRLFSLSKHSVTKTELTQLFSSLVIEQGLLDQLGAAFNSNKAIFIYGSAGTGKTYAIGKMMALFKDSCLIPHAIAVNDTIIGLFDPQIHVAKEASNNKSNLLYGRKCDPRFELCQRPVVVVGGELTADLLEVQYDPRLKVNQAPLQLKANGGIFFIDDIGRQSISPLAIFNRWIVPMEEAKDFLSLANGQHFEVPFDLQLVFSSNMNPLELADEAVLRRIGFKIRFEAVTEASYRKIWNQELAKNGIEADEDVINFVLQELHYKEEIELLPCHPRDLIAISLTQAAYLGEENILGIDRLRWAWKNYFVKLEL